MKKSNKIILGVLFLAAVASCNNEPEPEVEWISGKDANAQDTVVDNQPYRYYNDGWYPVYNDLICPLYYSRPYSIVEIHQMGFNPGDPVIGSRGSLGVGRGVSTGGFGSSAHGGGSGE